MVTKTQDDQHQTRRSDGASDRAVGRGAGPGRDVRREHLERPEQIGDNEIRMEFGDGASQTTTTPSIAHTFAAAATYAVTLSVTDALELTSAPATLTVARNAWRWRGGGGGGGTSTGQTTTGASAGAGAGQTAAPACGRCARLQARRSEHLAGGEPNRRGRAEGELRGPSSCTGTVTLRTLSAVSAGAKKKAGPDVGQRLLLGARRSVKSVALHLRRRPVPCSPAFMCFCGRNVTTIARVSSRRRTARSSSRWASAHEAGEQGTGLRREVKRHALDASAGAEKEPLANVRTAFFFAPALTALSVRSVTVPVQLLGPRSSPSARPRRFGSPPARCSLRRACSRAHARTAGAAV